MTWMERDHSLHKEVKTKDFMTAFRLVEAITPLAEAANHHPDLALGWGYVRITLTTHDAGGVTEKDHALAKQIDGIVGRFSF